MKVYWISPFFLRNYFLKFVIKEKIQGRIIEVTEGREHLPDDLNPLNAELNPVCHMLALLGAHHILHVSRIMVKEKVLETERGSTRSHSVDNSI